MAKDSSIRWQPPDRLAPGTKRWGYIQEIVSSGERWLEAQPFWSDLGRAEDIIRGKEMVQADENRSDLTSNRLKHLGREMVAAISDVRYPDDAWTSDNKAYAEEQTMLSKVARGIWYEAKAPFSVRRLTQWSLMGGTGYLWPVYRRRRMVDPYSMGMCFDAFGPRDVVPFMPDESNWQETYGCTMIKMMSLPKAHALFPKFQGRIKPVSKRRQQSTAVNARMAFISSLRGENQPVAAVDTLCEVCYTLIRDLAINDSDTPVPMGDPGASWSYVVPFLGQQIPTDYVESGQRKMREATIDDCRMYPNMRLMITISGVNEVVVDGPAWDWHGYLPPRFCSDDWVSEPMGLSIFRDVFDTERARQFTERAIDMKMKAQMDPGMKYDNTVINAGTAELLDPWKMRDRLGVDGDIEKAIGTILPPELMKIGTEPFEWIKYLCESQDQYLGTNQLDALAKAKMNTGQDGAEDLLKLAGPLVRDISAGMEIPMGDVLEMEKYQIIQHMNTARVMSYVGPDGVTRETFDFDPENVVPSHMPGEDEQASSKFSRMERGKNFCRQMRLTPTPGYLHGAPQQAQQLLLMQGSRAGLPISPRRILKKVFGIENFDQEVKEWQEWRMVEIELASKVREEGAALPGGQAPQTGSTPAGSQKGKGGRPASGNKPPAAKTKASAEGPRAVVSTSG